jgi:hypothetical protein
MKTVITFILAALVCGAAMADLNVIGIARTPDPNKIDIATDGRMATMPESIYTNCALWMPWSYYVDDSGTARYYDLSPEQNDGNQATAGQTPTFSSAEGGYLSFDGGDLIDIGGYYGILGATNRTCMAWIRTSSSTDQSLMSWGNAAANKLWWINIDQNSASAWAIRVAVNTAYRRYTTALTGGAWHHVAIVLDGSTMGDVDCYIDGVLDGVVDELSPSNVINTEGVYTINIGAYIDETLNMNGHMDDVRIFNRALTSNEIYAVVQETQH